MAFISSNQTRIIYGTDSLAALLRNVSPSANVEMLDATTLNDTAKTFVPGLEDFTLNVDGLFDNNTGAGTPFANIVAAVNATSTVPTSVAPSGFAVGSSVWLLPAKTITYEVTSAVADLVQFSMSLGAAEPPQIGVSLTDLTAFTSNGNGATVDNSAATSNGAIAQLHCTAASGTTPATVFTIQHSTNGSTWSTLQTFTTITSTTSQVVNITGTVNRYVRVIHTVSGTTPSFTCQVSLARN